MVFHDVARSGGCAAALAYQATHDALTGLINRVSSTAASTALLSCALGRRHDARPLYLDLDQFKLVNDTCGHQAGDELLKQITGLLQTRFAPATRSRDSAATSSASCCRIAPPIVPRRSPTACARRFASIRFEWHDGAMNVGVSIGIVEINSTSESIASVISAADVACYAAKDSGRNRVHMYQNGAAPGTTSRDAVGVAPDAGMRREPSRAVLSADRADR